MDQPARQHIRLILENATDRLNGSVSGKIEALRRTHAARGTLQSRNTVTSSIAIIEECSSQYISDVVDKVSAAAKDPEAFAMIAENMDLSLNAMAREMEDLIGRTFGGPGSFFGEMGHRKAALAKFHEVRGRLHRKLELHRFTFTVPHSPTPHTALDDDSKARVEKPKGGKPLAAHWDDMWAAMAVALYNGDLQPKTQADVERAMSDWLVSKGLEAAASTIRSRAQTLWRKLQEDK